MEGFPRSPGAHKVAMAAGVEAVGSATQTSPSQGPPAPYKCGVPSRAAALSPQKTTMSGGTGQPHQPAIPDVSVMKQWTCPHGMDTSSEHGPPFPPAGLPASAPPWKPNSPVPPRQGVPPKR